MAAEPFRREAQRRLALEVTALVHGADADGRRDRGIRGSLRPGRSRPRSMPRRCVARSRELPNADVAPARTVAQALVDTGLISSLGEARRAIAQGGVYAQQRRGRRRRPPCSAGRCPAVVSVLRRGKKTLAGVFTRVVLVFPPRWRRESASAGARHRRFWAPFQAAPRPHTPTDPRDSAEVGRCARGSKGATRPGCIADLPGSGTGVKYLLVTPKVRQAESFPASCGTNPHRVNIPSTCFADLDPRCARDGEPTRIGAHPRVPEACRSARVTTRRLGGRLEQLP